MSSYYRIWEVYSPLKHIAQDITKYLCTNPRKIHQNRGIVVLILGNHTGKNTSFVKKIINWEGKGIKKELS